MAEPSHTPTTVANVIASERGREATVPEHMGFIVVIMILSLFLTGVCSYNAWYYSEVFKSRKDKTDDFKHVGQAHALVWVNAVAAVAALFIFAWSLANLITQSKGKRAFKDALARVANKLTRDSATHRPNPHGGIRNLTHVYNSHYPNVYTEGHDGVAEEGGMMFRCDRFKPESLGNRVGGWFRSRTQNPYEQFRSASDPNGGRSVFESSAEDGNPQVLNYD